MTGVKCFWLEPAGTLRRSLRRYHTIAEGEEPCPLNPPQPNWRGYHNASLPYEVVTDPNPVPYVISPGDPGPPADDPRWPSRCGCGYEFTGDDERQVFVERIYRRSDTGEETTHRDAGPGAMFDADWYHGHPCWTGPDGRALMVILPNGSPWHIDGIANNCTDPDGAMRGDHKCWVRHGEPPDITVDKNGVTCQAGAGSIQSGDLHGFLRGGVLVPC